MDVGDFISQTLTQPFPPPSPTHTHLPLIQPHLQITQWVNIRA
jgi:hypothetical protein